MRKRTVAFADGTGESSAPALARTTGLVAEGSGCGGVDGGDDGIPRLLVQNPLTPVNLLVTVVSRGLCYAVYDPVDGIGSRVNNTITLRRASKTCRRRRRRYLAISSADVVSHGGSPYINSGDPEFKAF